MEISVEQYAQAWAKKAYVAELDMQDALGAYWAEGGWGEDMYLKNEPESTGI